MTSLAPPAILQSESDGGFLPRARSSLVPHPAIQNLRDGVCFGAAALQQGHLAEIPFLPFRIEFPRAYALPVIRPSGGAIYHNRICYPAR